MSSSPLRRAALAIAAIPAGAAALVVGLLAIVILFFVQLMLLGGLLALINAAGAGIEPSGVTAGIGVTLALAWTISVVAGSARAWRTTRAARRPPS